MEKSEAGSEAPPVRWRGVVALVVSLVAAGSTLLSIMPLAPGTGVPSIAFVGDIPFATMAVLWALPLVPVAILLAVFAGWHGGWNRRLALVGGIALALAGIYAIIVFGICDAQLRHEASLYD